MPCPGAWANGISDLRLPVQSHLSMIDLAARGVVALDPLASSRTPLADAARAFAPPRGEPG